MLDLEAETNPKAFPHNLRGKNSKQEDVTNFLKPHVIEVSPWCHLLGKNFSREFFLAFEFYLGLLYLTHQFLFVQSVNFSQKQTDITETGFSPLLSRAIHILVAVIDNTQEKHPNNKEHLQILSKRPTPDQSIQRTPDYASSPAKRSCKVQAGNHTTGEHVIPLNSQCSTLQSPSRGHQITLLLINYMFKDSSFLKNSIFFEQ